MTLTPWDGTSRRDLGTYDPQAEGARCDLCPLKGRPIVPYEPPRSGKHPLMIIVGEGPGRKEEIYRTPFIGQSGALLSDTLAEVNVSRRDVFVTNAALCAGHGENEKETAAASECCAPRLGRELSRLPKEIPIVTLGKEATRSVLGVKSILLARGFVWTARDLTEPVKNAHAAVRGMERRSSRARGKARDRTKAALRALHLRVQTLEARAALVGRTVLPTVHPAFVLRADAWTPHFRLDLDRAARWATGRLTAKHLADRLRRVKQPKGLAPGTFLASDDAATIIAAVARMTSVVLSCDIETEATQPLSPLTVKVLCVGLSDGARAVVIGPWRPDIHAGLLSKIFAGRKIVMHNGYNFDQPALMKDGVAIDADAVEDTLIAHHTFSSHMPQRLDHVVSTFLDAGPWKIKFGRKGAEEKGLPPQDMPEDELYFYNAADCVLTARAWHAMQADLRPELAVYEHDKRVALFCRDLQQTGFAVDVERRDELSVALRRSAASLKGLLRKICGVPTFAPGRLQEVRRILFTRLRAPMLNPTAGGLASTSNATLEVLRKGSNRAAHFSDKLLRWRVTGKIKGTYVDPVPVHADGRAHFNWKSFGTVSGRFSCRQQSVPRWSADLVERVREMYVAPPARELFYFDLSQAEARVAANLSGDPCFIETCKGDVHVGNAKVLFPHALEMLTRDPKGKHCPQHGGEGNANAACNCGKLYRDVAKNAGFAVAYLAEAATVYAYLRAQGFDVDLDQVESMLDRLRASYKVYYAYVAENIAFVQKNGYLRTALIGRVRWFGYYPRPTEIANFPIQSCIADCMNIRLLKIQRALPPRAVVVGQYHDAAIIEADEASPGPAEETPVGRLIAETWAEPVRLSKSVVCREPREFVLPTEVKRGRRWSDF